MKGQSAAEKQRILAIAGNPANGQVQALPSVPGGYRILQRTYFYNKAIKRGCDHIKTLGTVIDDRFYSKEEYHRKFTRFGKLRPAGTPKPSAQRVTAAAVAGDADMPAGNPAGALYGKMVGAVPILYRTAVNVGLVEDLTSVYGEVMGKEILSIACHWLSDRDNAARRFQRFASNFALPFTGNLSEQGLADLFFYLGTNEAALSRLFAARCARLPDGARVNYDSTSIPTTAKDVYLKGVSKQKDGSFGPMMHFSLLADQATGMPIFYRLWAGTTPDCSTVQDLVHCIEEIVKPSKQLCFVLDRGYETMPNLAACALAGKSVLMAARDLRQEFVERAIDAFSDYWDVSSCLPGTKVHGHTYRYEAEVQRQKFTLWVHVFRDDAHSDRETAAFMDRLGQFEHAWEQADVTQRLRLSQHRLMCFFEGRALDGTLERRQDVINGATRLYGFFADVSTCALTTTEAYEIYRRRDRIEKCFKSGKMNVNLEKVRAHSQETMQGRMVVGFVTLVLLAELNRQLGMERTFADKRRKRIGARDYTLTDVLDITRYLSIHYGRRSKAYWYQSRPAELERLCAAAGTPGVYDGLPEYLESPETLCR